MNILFVCKHNRFRSKVAEAFFRHYCKKEDVYVKSAGTVLSMSNPFISRNTLRILRDKGVSIRDDGAKKVDSFVVNWADKIILVGDNVVSELFKGRNIVAWPIGDVSENDPEAMSRKIDEIEKRVVELVKNI